MKRDKEESLSEGMAPLGVGGGGYTDGEGVARRTILTSS